LNERRPRAPTTRLDRIVALALAVLTVAWLLAAEAREGFGRDEGQYMRAGERYWGWFEELADNVKHRAVGRSFTQPAIDRFWSDNAPDHPVVMKTLYGLSWRAFHRCTCVGPTRAYHPIPIKGRHITLPLFRRDSTAFRFPAMLFAGLLIAMVYLFARRFVPRAAAAAGAVLAIAQPHYFFHAAIACFDAPITTMAFAVGFAYWKSLRSARWGVASGVVFGIALLLSVGVRAIIGPGERWDEIPLVRLRFRALVEVLLGTGARISEVLSLDRRDVDAQSREVKIIGKGKKQRVLFFTERAIEWLGRYLECRRDDEEPLFVLRGNQPRRLTYDAVKTVFHRFARRGRLKKKVTAHVLRHTVATTLLFNGCPIGHIKELLGHERLDTTCRYYLGLDVRAAGDAHQKFLRYE